jgi:DNA-directed RNA polymerase specialized sigma24 family protein
MTCPLTEQLERFLEEALDPVTRAELSAHVDGCRPCQGALEQLTEGPADLRDCLSSVRRRARDAPPSPSLPFLDRLKKAPSILTFARQAVNEGPAPPAERRPRPGSRCRAACGPVDCGEAFRDRRLITEEAPMSSDVPVTVWIQQLGAGDQAALQNLWHLYYPRLVGLARRRLEGTPCQVANEEDAALSAFKSFYRGVERGRFPRLADRHDLWQVLLMLTLRKASNQRRHFNARRRDGCRTREEDGRAIAELVSREPDPAFAAEVAEQCRWLMVQLRNDTLRQVALGKLEGHTNAEIAARLGCAEVTVQRKLHEIRAIWKKKSEE